MCLNEKLSHNIKVRSRISEFFLLKKNDFLKLSVNFQEQIQSFLSNSLLKYLKFNDEKKKIIKKFEKEHPEKFKHDSEDDDESKKEGNLELIKEDSEEESNGDSPKRKRKETMNSNKKSKSKSNSNLDSESKSSKSSNSSSSSKKKRKNSITRKSFLRAPKALMTRINSIGSQNDDYNSIFEIKQEVDNVKKNMFKNFNKNLEKMLSILEKNKDKFNNLEVKTNPMFYLKKMKHAKDQNEREEYLTQLRTLIESDDESENEDN